MSDRNECPIFSSYLELNEREALLFRLTIKTMVHTTSLTLLARASKEPPPSLLDRWHNDPPLQLAVVVHWLLAISACNFSFSAVPASFFAVPLPSHLSQAWSGPPPSSSSSSSSNYGMNGPPAWCTHTPLQYRLMDDACQSTFSSSNSIYIYTARRDTKSFTPPLYF